MTGSPPKATMTELTMPLSLLSIHAQVEAETISGSSHGTRNRARSTVDRRKFCRKNTASARPTTNCTTMDPNVNSRVFLSATGKAADPNTSA